MHLVAETIRNPMCLKISGVWWTPLVVLVGASPRQKVETAAMQLDDDERIDPRRDMGMEPRNIKGHQGTSRDLNNLVGGEWLP